MVDGSGKIGPGWSIGRMLLTGFCCLAGLAAWPQSTEAEIVKRDLGKNSKGEAVSGYVFQPGRSYRRRARTSNSVFGGRAERYRSGRGIDYGYQYPLFVPSFYYYVPHAYSYPIRYYRGGGSLSMCVSF